MIRRTIFASRRDALKKLAVAAGCALPAAWTSAPQADAAGRTPPPCSVDGVCLPKRDTWGWYRTNWRAWPGEQVHPTPTPAEGPKKDGESREDLGDLSLPAPTDEGKSEPEALKNAPPATGADADSQSPTPETDAETGRPDAGPGTTLAPRPGDQPPPIPMPGSDSTLPDVDPFGQSAPQRSAPMLMSPRGAHVTASTPQPAREPASDARPGSSAASADRSPVAVRSAPHSAGKQSAPGSAENQEADAPPTLPPSLLRRMTQTQSRPVGKSGDPTAQRPQIHANRFVTKTSAEQSTATGIRLINPAAARTVEPGATGLQPAIYYEATDRANQAP